MKATPPAGTSMPRLSSGVGPEPVPASMIFPICTPEKRTTAATKHQPATIWSRERKGRMADTAAALHPVIVGQNQRRLVDDAGNRLQPLRTQRRRVDGDAGVDQPAFAVVDREHLAGERPEIVGRGLRAAMAFVGAVAEPDDPFGGVPDMIGALLLRLRRDRRRQRARLPESLRDYPRSRPRRPAAGRGGRCGLGAMRGCAGLCL